MKHLRKAAALSILLIVIVMGAAWKGVQSTEESPQDQVEYFLAEGWSVGILDDTHVLDVAWEDSDLMRQLVKSVLLGGRCRSADLPYQGTSGPNDIVIYKNILPKETSGKKIRFSTQDSSVQVYLDGEIIYHCRHGAEESLEETDGVENHTVQIPEITGIGEIWILQWSAQADAAGSLDMVMMELRDMVVVGVVGNDILDIVCCLLIAIMAMIAFVIALIRRYTGLPGRGELYLGLACLVAGIYCFIGTDTLSIFYNLEEAYDGLGLCVYSGRDSGASAGAV